MGLARLRRVFIRPHAGVRDARDAEGCTMRDYRGASIPVASRRVRPPSLPPSRGDNEIAMRECILSTRDPMNSAPVLRKKGSFGGLFI